MFLFLPNILGFIRCYISLIQMEKICLCTFQKEGRNDLSSAITSLTLKLVPISSHLVHAFPIYLSDFGLSGEQGAGTKDKSLN